MAGETAEVVVLTKLLPEWSLSKNGSSTDQHELLRRCQHDPNFQFIKACSLNFRLPVIYNYIMSSRTSSFICEIC